MGAWEGPQRGVLTRVLRKPLRPGSLAAAGLDSHAARGVHLLHGVVQLHVVLAPRPRPLAELIKLKFPLLWHFLGTYYVQGTAGVQGCKRALAYPLQSEHGWRECWAHASRGLGCRVWAQRGRVGRQPWPRWGMKEAGCWAPVHHWHLLDGCGVNVVFIY